MPTTSPEPKRTRVLVVDDDLLIRTLLEANLEKHGHQVVLAESVAEAQEQIGALGVAAFDAVVTDYRMPGSTGLDLVGWLGDKDPGLATIMVTAEGERGLVADSLRGGVQDFLDKPLNIAQLIASVARATEATRRQRQLNAAELAVREIASVQHNLLKMHRGPIGDRVDVCFHPRQDAGGDFLGVFPVSPGRFVVLATDVSGHDLKAAFIASHFQGIVRGMLERQAGIAEVFRFFNEFLVSHWNLPGNWGPNSVTETSVAACALDVDLNARSISVLNCGFPLPVFLGSDGRLEPALDEGTSPLGWFPDLPMEPTVRPTHATGAVLLWSDGLEDLAVALGVDPLSVVTRLRLAKQHGEPVNDLLGRAKDDVLAVWLKLDETSPSQPPTYGVIGQRLAGRRVADIDALQQGWERSLRLALPRLRPTALHDVLLCLREGVINALRHGCAAAADRFATVQVDWQPATGRVRLDIQDPGPGHGFDAESHERQAETELVTEHRGLILMKHLSHSFRTERNGAGLRLEFRFA